jgi:hypothetical protein
MTPDAVPSVERLADVLAGCAKRRLPLKATAGLHHPFRHRGGPRLETNGAGATRGTKPVKAGKTAKAEAKAAAKTAARSAKAAAKSARSAEAGNSAKAGPASNGTAAPDTSAGVGPGSTMAQHGFVNLLAAAAAAVGEARRDELVQILDTEEHDGGQVLLGRLDRKARSLLRSIGSCSIDEPAEGLAALGLL